MTVQMTVEHLIDLLMKCKSTDVVKICDLNVDSIQRVAFVERFTTDSTVYLYTEIPDDLDSEYFNSIAKIDVNADAAIKITNRSENFIETTWVSNIELQKELVALFKSAADKAEGWHKLYSSRYAPPEAYVKHRELCFKAIWNPFWEIARHVQSLTWYEDPETTYEERMKVFLETKFASIS
jgi:hypothetical protein